MKKLLKNVSVALLVDHAWKLKQREYYYIWMSIILPTDWMFWKKYLVGLMSGITVMDNSVHGGWWRLGAQCMFPLLNRNERGLVGTEKNECVTAKREVC